MPAIFAFSSGGFVEKRKVSLLTELENVREWFSTKVPPLRGWGRVFHSNESRAGKRREVGNLCQSPKNDPTIYFTPKKATPHTAEK